MLSDYTSLLAYRKQAASKLFYQRCLGKAIGIELKDSYYKQMLLNLDDAEKRFKKTVKTVSLFDTM